MTVITKVNPIQTRPFQGSRKLTVESFMVVPKKLYGGVRENIWNILKLSTSSVKFYWRQQLLSGISQVTEI